MSRQIMGLGPSIARGKSVLVKTLLLVALGLPAWVPLTGVQAVDQTSASVDTKPQTQTPFRRRTITIDDQVKRFTESLDLSETQQSEIKKILEFRQVQIRRIRLDESLSGDERIGRLRGVQDSTVARIRAVLNDEQKKKYDPLAVRQAQKSSPQPSVEDWMKAAAKQK
jgi:ABC-type lipopolysaccharide export system ATPase subunit